jgi:hypothetical protein
LREEVLVFEVLLVHAVFEYLLQREVTLAQKRTSTVVGLLRLVAHAAMPAAACVALGVATIEQAGAVMGLHIALDSSFGAWLLSVLPIQSVYKTMSEPEHERWPIQVQALQFALSASSEAMWWATIHAVAVYIGMTGVGTL